MKRLFWKTWLFVLLLAGPVPAVAAVDVDVNVNVGLPPPITFAAPPSMIVLPQTNVYVAPEVNADIYFYNGWWWRLWEGRWFRSRNHQSGWAPFHRVPAFYKDIPPGWRNDYRIHRWEGHPWNYQRIPHDQMQRNWRGWERNRHWERQQNWGVQGLKPSARSPQSSREVKPGTPQPRQQRIESRPNQSPQFREGAQPSRRNINQRQQQREEPTPARREIKNRQKDNAAPAREDRLNRKQRERD